MLKFTPIRILFVIIMAVMFGLDMFAFPIANYWFVLPVLIFLILIVVGSYQIQLQFFLNSYNRGKSVGNSIALTFDDGPHEINTLRVLEVLDKHDAKATFFCIGSQFATKESVVKEIISRGHSIGNHSYHHRHTFPMYSTKTMVEEIEKTNVEIEKYTGKVNDLFRPPFGVTNPRIAKAVHRTKMKVIGWNVRSYDTVGHEVYKVVNRVTSKLQSGSIVLLHDDRESTPEILEGILQYMDRKGLKSVNVEELLN